MRITFLMIALLVLGGITSEALAGALNSSGVSSNPVFTGSPTAASACDVFC